MNDSTQHNIEDKEPKRRSKLPLLLLIAAVILGLIIWRIKSSGGPSETSVPVQDTVSKPAPVAQPAKPDTTPAPAAAPAPAPAPKPKDIVSAAPQKPVHKIRHHKAPTTEPRIVASERQGDLRIVGGSPAPAKEEPMVAASKPAAKPAEEPIIAAPKPVEKPVAAVPPPAKKFAPEDQPLPEKPSLSEEGKLAMNTMPKTTEAPGEAVAASPGASDAYKQGMDAYHKKDYAGAVQQFGNLPKPTTKQRGNAAREEYVQGNFLMGVSLMRLDRASDAVTAFLTVLDYEKYYPVANMNLGICYVELRQYFKANKTFEAVIRDQGSIEPEDYDDVMQRTRYFWALAWTRMCKTAKDPNKQAYYQQQAIQHWKDYQTWFGKNVKYRADNRRADDYLKSLTET